MSHCHVAKHFVKRAFNMEIKYTRKSTGLWLKLVPAVSSLGMPGLQVLYSDYLHDMGPSYNITWII
jgi:hypothetical protein